MDAIQNTSAAPAARWPRDKRKLAGSEPPLQPKHVWAIRTGLLKRRKLRGCDAVGLKVEDIAPNGWPPGGVNTRYAGIVRTGAS